MQSIDETIVSEQVEDDVCMFCGGSGEYQISEDDFETCRHCQGTGEYTEGDTYCQQCDGTGFNEDWDAVCLGCGGRG